MLTDNGLLIKQLTHPIQHVEKTYWVMIEGDPKPDRLSRLEKGIQLRDYRTLPAKVRLISDPNLPLRSKLVTPHGPIAWIELKLHEGRKWQIHHMTAAVGLPTLRLVRVAIGQIHIANLEPGKWRDLTLDEINLLKK